jgi:UDP-N-acetylmuramoyl-L-alanyl-D-glutamate--2,6-diaminopimelate ligase
MKLGRLIQDLEHAEMVRVDPDLEIEGLAYDSREVRSGFLFVAIRGHTQDGHAFLHDAVDRGAVALVVDSVDNAGTAAAVIRVPETRSALAEMASRFYGDPFQDLELIGITGTNGKTSTSYILESILKSAGARPGVIGTINYRYAGTSRPATVTTPESLELMATLREMVDHGVTHGIMEVSSHALDQGRVQGCPFEVVVFTNLSRDHLDYHADMEAYFEAKSLLFRPPEDRGFSGEGHAVLNLDDPLGKRIASLSRRPVLSYGLASNCSVRAESLVMERAGIRAVLETPQGACELRSSLIGRLNVYNILAACGAALSLGVGLDAVAAGVERLRGIPGRLERVKNPCGLSLVVDYAHTPDALLKVLETLRPLAEGRLITVVGCGGDRDRGKRSEMGALAGRFSDWVVVTSDNPRTEDPMRIIAQVEEGVAGAGLPRVKGDEGPLDSGPGYMVEPDRRRAIQKAVMGANRRDLVLIAGKGHENYQILGTKKVHFDDREEAARAAAACAA